jgi:hypothetical protein
MQNWGQPVLPAFTEENVKTTTVGILICAIALSLTVLPCPAASEKAFTALETACYSCVCATCDQGSVTPLPGGQLQLRNRETIYFYTASDTRAAGYFRVLLNSNTDGAFNGTLWGAFYSCDSAGNRVSDGWEGTWNGQIFAAFPSNWINKVVAYGTGGNSGLRMEATTVYGDALTGTMVGTIENLKQ